MCRMMNGDDLTEQGSCVTLRNYTHHSNHTIIVIKSNRIKFICDTKIQIPMKEVKQKVMSQQDTRQQRAALTGAPIEKIRTKIKPMAIH